MNRPEDRLHIQVAHFLRVACPDLLFYHAPNGGGRDAREAAKLKAMGVRRGVADLAFVLPDGRAAFIELKADKGRQSPHQKLFEEDCARRGVPYLICRSLAEVEGALAAWGIPTRARAA
jgi:hypothetical protein